MSPLPGKVTDLLSPCRLTGCRVTDKSSQEAAGQEAYLEEHMKEGVTSSGAGIVVHSQMCLELEN